MAAHGAATSSTCPKPTSLCSWCHAEHLGPLCTGCKAHGAQLARESGETSNM